MNKHTVRTVGELMSALKNYTEDKKLISTGVYAGYDPVQTEDVEVEEDGNHLYVGGAKDI
jgi:hypothetical protein